MSQHNRRALSLFSGAGGLDLGLEQAGWNVLAQIEMDAAAVETLEYHAKTVETPPTVIGRTIEEVDPLWLRGQLGLRPGELDLLAGGPPCQPFTTSGLRRGLLDRRASSLFPKYLEFVDALAPKSILIENVDGILSAALQHRPLVNRGRLAPPMRREEMKGSFLRWLLSELAARMYALSWGVVEAADYGVPQMRQRAIIIGVRDRQPCFLPRPTHGHPDLPTYCTTREALASIVEPSPVQPLSARKRAVYRLIPPGGNWRDLPREVQRDTMGAAFFAEGGRSGWWRRLAWDMPSPTILGMPDHSSTALIHPEEVRCLSVAECAALQSFPGSKTFAGSARSQYQQIGNSVPPLLARRVGEHMASFLDGERQPAPEPPPYRKASANRRIGTHGWALPGPAEPDWHLTVKVRPDHIWSHEQIELYA